MEVTPLWPHKLSQRGTVKRKALPKVGRRIQQDYEARAVARLRAARPDVDYNFDTGSHLELELALPELGGRTSKVRGVVLRLRKRGLGSTFVLRSVENGEGVERTIPLYSPNMKKCRVIGSRKVRRANISFIRDLKLAVSRVGASK